MLVSQRSRMAWGMLLGALAGCSALGGSSGPATGTAPPAPASAVAAPTDPVAGPCGSTRVGPRGESSTVHTYADGRRVRSQTDGPAGSHQSVVSYDADGRRTTEVHIDGAALRRSTFVYDQGLLVRTDVADGTGAVTERHHRIYGLDGKLQQRQVEHRVAAAGAALPSFATRELHELHYDADGRFAYELETRFAPDGTQSVRSVTVEVDAQGRVVARRTDEGMTGTFEQTSLFGYAALGRGEGRGALASMTRLQGEAVVEVSRHRYDEVLGGRRLVETTVEDGRGVVHTRVRYDFSCWDPSA